MKLCAEKKLPEPRIEDVVELVPNKGPIGKSFKQGCILTGYLCCLLLFDTNKKNGIFTSVRAARRSSMAGFSPGDILEIVANRGQRDMGT